MRRHRHRKEVIVMQNETITLTRDHVMEMIKRYAETERRGKDLAAMAKAQMNEVTTDEEREKRRVVYEMYLYQQGKSAGFKEAYEEIIYRVDGKFPDTKSKEG